MTTYSFHATTLTLDNAGNAIGVAASTVEIFSGGSVGWGALFANYINWDDQTDTAIGTFYPMLRIDGAVVDATLRWSLADDGTNETVILEFVSENSITVLQADGDDLPFGTLGSANNWLDQVERSRILTGDWAGGQPILLSALDGFFTLTELDNLTLERVFAEGNGDGIQTLNNQLATYGFTGIGNDTVTGTNWFDVIDGGDGDDRIHTGGNPGWSAQWEYEQEEFGYEWWNDINYSWYDREFAWEDIANGGAGNDRIEAGVGNAWLSGGDGNDTIIASLNWNRSNGEFGVESYGGAGNDEMRGGNRAGYEYFDGGDGNDTVFGGNGQNDFQGGSGDDHLFGGVDFDDMTGGAGRDSMVGAAGNDILVGQDGNDTLSGGAGQDRLIGGTGNDRLIGGAGRDDLQGDTGADRFQFALGSGRDLIRDFNAAESDRLVISQALAGTASTGAQVLNRFAIEEFGNVVLDFGGGDRILVLGADIADLAGAVLVV